MKISEIYKQKEHVLSKDIITSILNYMNSLKLENVLINDFDDYSITLSSKNSTVLTSNNDDYDLSELHVESLIYILEKLENGEYEKIK